jgi:RNA polymerase sigma factor (sigma-70 family)
LKMVESLGELRAPEQFWPWLFRTALGHVQHHFRAEKQRRRIEMSACDRERLRDRLADIHDDGLTFASRRELMGTIFQAMSRIKLNYRNVVVLRCVEDMSYEEIAGVLNCKELYARVLFFRARNALRRQLTRRGCREGLLLTALGLFKLATSHAKGVSAAGSIHAACLDVGLLAAVVGSIGTQIGILVAACFGFLAAAMTLEVFLCIVALMVFVLVCAVVTLYVELS